MKHNVLVTIKEYSRDLNNPNSSSDCSIRVFCQQVYVLLEYFVTVVCSIRVVQ